MNPLNVIVVSNLSIINVSMFVVSITQHDCYQCDFIQLLSKLMISTNV